MTPGLFSGLLFCSASVVLYLRLFRGHSIFGGGEPDSSVSVRQRLIWAPEEPNEHQHEGGLR